MILSRDEQLLLPANPVFIGASLAVAFGLNMLLNMGVWGRAAWAPDIVAVALVFWSVHQPRRVGMGLAFMFGLFTDVHQGSMLGLHALAYAVLSFFAIALHRRLWWFGVPSQALQLLPLFIVAHLIELALRMIGGGSFPGIGLLLSPLLETALWPLVSTVLLAPQRRAPDQDENRVL